MQKVQLRNSLQIAKCIYNHLFDPNFRNLLNLLRDYKYKKFK